MGKTENLKEMRDVSSGMASTIMQVYLKPLLESFLHAEMKVRHASLQVVQTIVNQGLVTPAFVSIQPGSLVPSCLKLENVRWLFFPPDNALPDCHEHRR